MATTTMNIALPDEMRAFVTSRVTDGQYGNTSEYVRDLIRRDQERLRLQRLRELLEEGLASGPAQPMSAQDWNELQSIADGRTE